MRFTGWYRVVQPLDALAANGWKISYAAGRPPAEHEQYRAVTAQRLDQPGVLKEWRSLRLRHRLAYEIDDDCWSIGKANWAAYTTYNREDVLDVMVHAAEIADLITVSTEHLAHVMRERTGHPKIRVCPNSVPDELLTMQRARSGPKRVTVGWAGGSSHALDVAMVAIPVHDVVMQTPGAELHVYGTDFRPTFGLHPPKVRYTPWVPVNATLDYYKRIDFDIALAPLTGTVFDESKCVDSSMRICTDQGVLEAGELRPGMKVWRGGWRAIEAAEHSIPRLGLLITTEGGYQLRLTAEHRMLVNGEWTQAGAIRPGDRMAMEPEWCGVREAVRVPWPADSRMSRAWKGRPPADPFAFLTAPDGPRLSITPRWGRFLGAFAGDGSVGQATLVQMSCDGQDQDWIDLLMEDFRAFGLNPHTEAITTFDGIVLRRRSVEVASAHLLRVLASLGVTRPRESGKPIRVPCVPEVIWRSPRAVIAEFLAGYFETDGHCTRNGVGIVSKEEKLIRDVQRLLLLFGITSVVQTRIHRAQNGFSGTYWHLNLRRAEADVFAKEIGFRSARKKARLASIADRPHSLSSFHPMEWSRAVVSVEKCMVTPIDIQVEGSEFIAAGFVSHNSNIKALESMALGIPVLASDCEAYRGVVIDGVNGYLIRRKKDWAKRLRELVSDREAREVMGAAARVTAKAHVMSANWDKWAAAYSELQ